MTTSGNPTPSSLSYPTISPCQDGSWNVIAKPRRSVCAPPSTHLRTRALTTGSRAVLIVAEIVRKIYPVKNSMREPKRARLAELETALDQWYIDLPETLRFDSASKRATPPPHVLLLHVRYWSAVLLLHRAL